MSIYLKESPSVLNILFQRETFDLTTGEDIKNELKVAITFEYLYKKASSIEKISYTLVSLINHDGESLHCGHYFSDIFDANTGIWWHFDNNNITQISDLPKGVILERVRKNKKQNIMSVSTYVLFVVYIKTRHLKNTALFYSRISNHVQNQSYGESN